MKIAMTDKAKAGPIEEEFYQMTIGMHNLAWQIDYKKAYQGLVQFNAECLEDLISENAKYVDVSSLTETTN